MEQSDYRYMKKIDDYLFRYHPDNFKLQKALVLRRKIDNLEKKYSYVIREESLRNELSYHSFDIGSTRSLLDAPPIFKKDDTYLEYSYQRSKTLMGRLLKLDDFISRVDPCWRHRCFGESFRG